MEMYAVFDQRLGLWSKLHSAFHQNRASIVLCNAGIQERSSHLRQHHKSDFKTTARDSTIVIINTQNEKEIRLDQYRQELPASSWL
jgi:3-deoxy-D-manno-octulosonic-acid transferase